MSGRDRAILAAIVVLAIVAGSWLLVIAPKRDQAAKLAKQISATQSQLDSLRSELAQGESARRAFATDYAELVRLGEAVPTDDNVPSMIYQLQGAASATGVDFRGLQLNPGSGGSAPPSSPSASQASTATLPPGASVGPAGFPIEPFTFTFQGNFFHIANFFHRLERFVVATNKRIAINGRLMSLNSISLGPGGQGFPQIIATVSATTYLVPASEGLLAGATPSSPASGSGTQPASAAPSSTATPTAAITHP